MVFDDITIYIFGPISAPLNYSFGEYAYLSDINLTYLHTKATVKDDNFCHAEDTLCEAQKQTSSGASYVTKLLGLFLIFSDLPCPQPVHTVTIVQRDIKK